MKRLFVWVLLGLALGLSLVRAAPASAACDPCTDFDQVIDPPQYLLHATGHGTTDGLRADDWWFLFPQAPDSRGVVTLPDGEGGTFGYNTDHSSGPYTTPRAACAAAAAAGVQDFVVTPWNWDSHWHCKDVNGVNGNDNGGNNNGGNDNGGNDNGGNNNGGNDNGGNDNGGNDNGGNDTPAPQLNAWLDCGNSLDLPMGNPARPAPCGIVVTGYRINTSDDVIYTFPTLIPSQGVGEMLPGPIAVSQGNWSENPDNFLDSGPEHHTTSWLFSRCPQPGVCTTATPPGTYTVPIIVSQAGAGAVTLNLNLTVGASGGGTGSASLDFFDRPGDVVGKYDFKPDGAPDARFHLMVSSGGNAITYMRLDMVDQNGSYIPGAPRWDTQPNPNNPGSYALGVYDWTTGQQINGPNYALDAAVPGEYQLLATDAGNGQSYFQPGQRFLLTIEFDNTTFTQIELSVTIPPVVTQSVSIAGEWDSDFGPVTLVESATGGNRLVSVSGSWSEAPDETGQISNGSFDPVSGVLEFSYYEPWKDITGSARFTLSPDGGTLQGTWTQPDGSGSWVLTR